MSNADYFLELIIKNPKQKQKEIIKRKLDTYNYIFSRKEIAAEIPFIITREYQNIPNSSQKKLENDVNDLEKTKRVSVKSKSYLDPSTNKVIPRAKFITPIKTLMKNESFMKLAESYLDSFFQENNKE